MLIGKFHGIEASMKQSINGYDEMEGRCPYFKASMPIMNMEQRFIRSGIDSSVAYLVLNYRLLKLNTSSLPMFSILFDLDFCDCGKYHFWKSNIYDTNGVKYIFFMDELKNLYLEFLG